ncbi:hypothetical protein F5J12DRAFT_482694 [Pisolithus orientalis]|uniref:uncharacterized protein n=1 Tax=Pisolithus orientalis TaxID=936130 RepID=UPI0022250CE0|nr:uncharacterized protein F5J12DRAFT_482694 [Pisolithus orientalis]KAI6019677.1 hypothetical protein F5J12DRAFT_482694 [Pisolithus orientalis]
MIQGTTSITTLQKLCDSLFKSHLPRFINCRLELPSSAHPVAAIQLKRSALHVVYNIQASGLVPHELENMDMSPEALQLVCPWNSKLIGPSARLDPITAQQLLLILGQPFSALLLAELPHSEYERTASSTTIAQPIRSRNSSHRKKSSSSTKTGFPLEPSGASLPR